MKTNPIITAMIVAVVIASAGWGGYSILRGKAVVLVPAPVGTKQVNSDGAIQINTGTLSAEPSLRFRCNGRWFAVAASSEAS